MGGGEPTTTINCNNNHSLARILYQCECFQHHISDWTDSSSIKTYPNPLSLKDKVPSSWFIGLNDAVAAKVNIDALETIDDNCLLPDDYFENCTNGVKEEDCEAWSECQGLCSSWTACQ